MRFSIRCLLFIALLSAFTVAGSVDESWKQHVPDKDRTRPNPVAGQPEAIAAGGRLFSDHCAKCHGSDASGRDKKPTLRGPEVQNASDGEISWLLRNGYVRKGMPSWSAIPEASRWQIIAYIKSLGLAK